jgi:hypothetical protein
MTSAEQAKRVSDIGRIADLLREADRELNRLSLPGVLPEYRRLQFIQSIRDLDTYGAYRALTALADEWQAELDASQAA